LKKVNRRLRAQECNYRITADIYAQVAPELKQVAADAIDEALGGGA
jgi:hypothetical protein